MHHHCVHPIGHREGLEVGLYRHGQRQLVDQVDGRAGDNRSAAQVLESEDWRQKGRRESYFNLVLSCYSIS